MKSIFKNAIIVAALLLGAAGISNAQVKVGANPTTIGSTSNLEVEATNAKKVLVNKADGSVVIENTPAGAGTDKYLTVDAAGNIRSIVPPVSSTTGVSGLYRGKITTGINVGACPASLSVGGYFTSASCGTFTNSTVKTILTITFPSVGTTDYEVFSTNNAGAITMAQADAVNDILLPLIYDKTSTSFKVFLEEGAATISESNFSFMIVK